MYNLVWQSVMCRPGKLLILLIRRIRCCAQPLRPPDDIRPLGKTRRREQANLGRAFALPPSAHPQASHPDCRSVLTLIVAPHLSPAGQITPAASSSKPVTFGMGKTQECRIRETLAATLPHCSWRPRFRGLIGAKEVIG